MILGRRGREGDGAAMEGELAAKEFPGFRTDILHRDEYACRRLPQAPTRLQRRAPRPLEIKNRPPGDQDAAVFSLGLSPLASPSTSPVSSRMDGASDSRPFSPSKDPIPLLSPLVVKPAPQTVTASGQALSSVENIAAGLH
ncbi:hypothetical protein SAY87_024996 [Trapa incisa]|uniref:Uncharacterized protein n=1 Tax=Trapa incisa TaxID=236973 RepID=A0AAN7GKS1_9MYRT|nr:hypothetical protein SAY87_024996 [Trapa incisa]